MCDAFAIKHFHEALAFKLPGLRMHLSVRGANLYTLRPELTRTRLARGAPRSAKSLELYESRSRRRRRAAKPVTKTLTRRSSQLRLPNSRCLKYWKPRKRALRV